MQPQETNPAPQPTTPLPAAPTAQPEPQTTGASPAGEWPGAFGLYKISRAVVRPNIWTIVGLVVVTLGISIAISSLFGSESFVGSVLAMVFEAILSVILVAVILASIRGERTPFDRSFKLATAGMMLNYFLYTIAFGIVALLSLLALIVPFFFIVPRFLLTDYFIVDQKQSTIEAMKSSWALTKGHLGKIYGIIGVFILLVLLMVTIIGIPFAIYFFFMYSAALGLLYSYLRGNALPSSEAGVPATTVTPAQPTVQQ